MADDEFEQLPVGVGRQELLALERAVELVDLPLAVAHRVGQPRLAVLGRGRQMRQALGHSVQLRGHGELQLQQLPSRVLS